MQPRKTSTKCGGIDVGKHWLDAAVHGAPQSLRVKRDEAGLGQLMCWLQGQGVGRVGLEASGGYEGLVIEVLQDSFEVVVHQPLEVRLFAKLKRLRAKNDRLDAHLIAASTAQVDAVKACADRRLRELAERLTAYEQVSDQLAQLRTFMEHVRLKDVEQALRGQIGSLVRLKTKLAADVRKGIVAHDDLKARYRLLLSLPGVGPIVAASLVVRMPELGQMKRGQAAALIGVAPYDRDSGNMKGQRVIAGGRRRPRRQLYMAALSAKRWDPSLKAFASRLTDRGKNAKAVIVAVMRKLIEVANLVLARGTPWTSAVPA